MGLSYIRLSYTGSSLFVRVVAVFSSDFFTIRKISNVTCLSLNDDFTKLNISLKE